VVYRRSNISYLYLTLTVASLGCAGGADRPGWHPPGGDTLRKNLFRQIYKEQWRNEVGQVKGAGWYPPGVWHSSEINEKWQWWAKKSRQVFRRKLTGVTPQKWRLKRSPGFSGKKIKGWHPQLPPRCRSPTLVTPLDININFSTIHKCRRTDKCAYDNSQNGARCRKTLCSCVFCWISLCSNICVIVRKSDCPNLKINTSIMVTMILIILYLSKSTSLYVRRTAYCIQYIHQTTEISNLKKNNDKKG